MEKCQRLLAQMRFDIMCQFGQLDETDVKSAPLNLAKAMGRNDQDDMAEESNTAPLFPFEEGLDYSCLSQLDEYGELVDD